ncbi:MAG: Lrp/AsnC family transcriptional regulator [Acidobacteriota bacterium]|nr:MAG: Lrp/AsnC family transcriptional regulator [Acidobacteriota bacterium]
MNLETEKLMDEKGWRILEELQSNARISFSALGRRVGLSVPAVTERVRKMEDAGIITGYHAVVNAEKVGYPIIAFIRMSVSGDVSSKITSLIEPMPEVIECHKGTGGDSFIIKIRVTSVHHLEKVIEKLLPYGTTSTSIVLSSPVTMRLIERPEG